MKLLHALKITMITAATIAIGIGIGFLEDKAIEWIQSPEGQSSWLVEATPQLANLTSFTDRIASFASADTSTAATTEVVAYANEGVVINPDGTTSYQLGEVADTNTGASTQSVMTNPDTGEVYTVFTSTDENGNVTTYTESGDLTNVGLADTTTGATNYVTQTDPVTGEVYTVITSTSADGSVETITEPGVVTTSTTALADTVTGSTVSVETTTSSASVDANGNFILSTAVVNNTTGTPSEDTVTGATSEHDDDYDDDHDDHDEDDDDHDHDDNDDHDDDDHDEDDD